MATHTVFGNGTPAYVPSVYTNPPDGIILSNIYYLKNDNGPAVGWYCTGGRVYIPDDPSVNSRSITLYAWTGNNLKAMNYANSPDGEIVTTTPTNGGWCEVTWPSAILMDYGPSYAWIAIGYKFNDPADKDKYIACTEMAGPPPNDYPSVTAGDTLVLAHSDEPGYVEWVDRGSFGIEGDPSPFGSNLWYGTDIIVDDNYSPPGLTPAAEYGFNEGFGNTTIDSSGNARDMIVTDPTLFTTGHYGTGLKQVDSTYSINGSISWLSTATNPQFTLMFWGRREIDGTLGNSWTVRQTVFGGGTVAWGIKMSDGANTIAEVFIQGFTVTMLLPLQPVGEWHHYTLVTNGYFTRCYIDGSMVYEVGANGVVGTSGVNNDQNLLVYGGEMQQQVIDDLRIFQYALNPSQITSYMMIDVIANSRPGKVKVWDGSQWNAHPLKTWNGTSWSIHPMKGSSDGVQFVTGKS